MSDWTAFDEHARRNIIGDPPSYTLEEVAERSGLDVGQIRRFLLAAGLPRPEAAAAAFSDADLPVLASFALACEAFGEDATLHFTRAMGIGSARIANAAFTLFLFTMAEGVRGRPEDELRTAVEQSGLVFNSLPPVIEQLVRQHALRALERWLQHLDSDAPYDAPTVAIGFVDLVGYTEQTRDMATGTLADLVTRFEAGAHDAVTASGGEVVKLIGDAVMFVADTAEQSCAVALALDRAFAEVAVTPRGGLALGPVLARGGDFYGPVVNTAARLSALAAPGEVLVTSAVRDAAITEGSLAFEPAGRRVLKGFADPVEAFSLTRGG